VPCCAVLCCAVLCRAVPCRAVLCRAVLPGGESDVRSCYTAMAVATSLCLDVRALAAKAGMVDYVRRCQVGAGPSSGCFYPLCLGFSKSGICLVSCVFRIYRHFQEPLLGIPVFEIARA